MTSPRVDNIIPFPGQRHVRKIYRFRIDLVMMPQPIWRVIEVPNDYTFWDLHVAIQDAMGWEDCHLHLFTVDKPRTAERAYFGIPDRSGFHGAREIQAGWDQKIDEFFVPDHAPALYTYDFGDDWQHEVVLEAAADAAAKTIYPCCRDGRGACPPEDCGGPPGYEDFLRGLTQPESEEEAEYVAAFLKDYGAAHGVAYDPARFDPAAVVFDDPRRRWEDAFGKK